MQADPPEFTSASASHRVSRGGNPSASASANHLATDLPSRFGKGSASRHPSHAPSRSGIRRNRSPRWAGFRARIRRPGPAEIRHSTHLGNHLGNCPGNGSQVDCGRELPRHGMSDLWRGLRRGVLRDYAVQSQGQGLDESSGGLRGEPLCGLGAVLDRDSQVGYRRGFHSDFCCDCCGESLGGSPSSGEGHDCGRRPGRRHILGAVCLERRGQFCG